MSIFKNSKKGQIPPVVNKFVSFVIGIAVVFFIGAAIIPEAQTAGDDLGDSARCSSSGGFFNTSQSLCLNGTSPADTAQVSFKAIPLSSLFAAGGIVFILIAVFLLNMIIRGPRGQ